VTDPVETWVLDADQKVAEAQLRPLLESAVQAKLDVLDRVTARTPWWKVRTHVGLRIIRFRLLNDA
jgi:hypothetical protein